MKIPDKNKKPFSYNKWKQLDLLNASRTERILMLKLFEMETFKHWLDGSSWWDVDDMREFVRIVSKEIDKKGD